MSIENGIDGVLVRKYFFNEEVFYLNKNNKRGQRLNIVMRVSTHDGVISIFGFTNVQ